MRRRFQIIAAAVALAVVALGSPLGARLAYADGILAGPTFNIPTSTDTYDQNAILRKIMRGIDGAPSGETIRMAFFSLTVPRFADKLIAAHQRGVNVRLIQDDHEVGPDWQRLVAAFGGDTKKRSWALLCHRSCMSDEEPSYMHAKLYMFSRTLSTPLVVMISSANPTFTQARIGWNDMYTITRNSTIYTASRTYFEMLTAGALEDRAGDQSEGVPIDAYFTATSGIFKTYYFPKGGEGKDDDPVYGILSNIGCRGTATGYGSSGRTTVKVAMYQWTWHRVRLAEKLWDLDNAGCIVEVLVDAIATEQPVIDALTKPGGAYGGIKLTKTHEDTNGDGIAEHFVHNKYILVNGIYGADTSSKIVFTGSGNWSNAALHYGNEIMLRIVDNAAYTAYADQFATLNAWAKSIPPPPPPTPTPPPSATPGPSSTTPPPTPTSPPPTPTAPPPTPTAPPPSASVPPASPGPLPPPP